MVANYIFIYICIFIYIFSECKIFYNKSSVTEIQKFIITLNDYIVINYASWFKINEHN